MSEPAPVGRNARQVRPCVGSTCVLCREFTGDVEVSLSIVQIPGRLFRHRTLCIPCADAVAGAFDP